MRPADLGIDNAALVDALIRDGHLRHPWSDAEALYVPLQTMEYYLSPGVRRLSMIVAAVVIIVFGILLWMGPR